MIWGEKTEKVMLKGQNSALVLAAMFELKVIKDAREAYNQTKKKKKRKKRKK